METFQEEPLVVVALAGQARVGKDTIASRLISEHSFTRMAFADGLRAALGAASGSSWDILKEIEASGKSLRRSMQVIGTECRRDVGCQDHWVDQVGILIRYLSHYHPNPRCRFVITDMRYRTEAVRLREILIPWQARLEVWKVERPDRPQLAAAEAAHSSETSVAEIVSDRTIWNIGTKADLFVTVEDKVSRFLMGGQGGSNDISC
jgi:hypothetical protein